MIIRLAPPNFKQQKRVAGSRKALDFWVTLDCVCVCYEVCRAYTPIYRGTQIQYRERKTLGKGILSCRAYTLIYRGTEIKYRERNHWEKGILHCRAYTPIYRGTQIQYRDGKTLGEGNPVLQSLHSNIQRDMDTIPREGTIGRRGILSCRAYTPIYRGIQ
ncbi:hypothetical protein XELAEV_18019050mg [Xenopus laevis]|uniref:Uncharacterized protein n=1 Tax=Xenopus laevis TaxID=8355 RepID=A0A974HUH6_XENLA|nr:hypothetical protein XELAEV_18019050mg [Xenopus laevis]